MSDIFDSPEYRRSRTAYHFQCVTEYLVSLLVADAYLAKLLKSMGLPDSLIGVISSLTSLAFLVEMFTILLMQHIQNVKKTVIFIDVGSMFLFMCTYLVPGLSVTQNVRTILVFATISGGFLLKYLQLNLYYRWGQSFVRPDSRGIFSAKNEVISLVAGIVFTLIIGNAVDYYERIGRLSACFLLIAGVIGILAVLDLIFLLLIHPYSREDAEHQHKPFRRIAENTFGNRNFRNIVIMISLHHIARYLTIGFLGTFKTQELLLTVGTVQLINIAGNILRCVLSEPIGRMADRVSYVRVYRMALWLCAFAFLLLAFTSLSRWYLIVAYTICYDVSMAGIESNANNMTYSYVPIDYYIPAQAIRSSIAGLLGFGASLVGSRILAAVQANGNHLLGLPVYGQQVLAGLSFLIILCAIAFNKRVVSGQRIMKQ